MQMLGSMLALAVGEWLRAEGPSKSVRWRLAVLCDALFAFLFSSQSVVNSRISQCRGCQPLSFLPVQMSSFQSVLVSYFSNSEIC